MIDDATCIPELRITLPARADSLALLRHVARGFRDAYAISTDRMDDIVLALSEAATNAALHAYGKRPGTITVFARVDEATLRILVRDHGIGIAPEDHAPIPGHGLSLMAHVSESMEIVGSPAGTDVLMTFPLVTQAGDDDVALGDLDATR
jgi:serine/threonine-protein kinase RsbW/stage II sporulation protein AB (anti-sigma F factor)